MAPWICFILQCALGHFGVFSPTVSECSEIVPELLKGTTHQVQGMFDFAPSFTDERFLSLNLALSHLIIRAEGFDFRSKQLQILAHALSPCLVRVGGIPADHITFDPESRNREDYHGSGTADYLKFYDVSQYDVSGHKFRNYTLSGKFWKTVAGFFKDVGWDMMFDLNLFKWHNGHWDPTNAQLLLNYSDAMGFDIPAFQLGNEPNSYKVKSNLTIEPEILAKDFKILKKLISTFTRYQNSQLFGPDVTNVKARNSARIYLKKFLEAGGNDVVSEVSLHHYYLNGHTATVEDFLNVTVFDFLKSEIEIALNITQSQPHPKPIAFTETATCYGGGAPELSNRFISGFPWLDKLGMSAKYGVRKVFRQDFFPGKYALVQRNISQPNPNFYLSVLHKRLILGPVFNVTFHPVNKQLRLYAHCTRTDFYGFAKGSVTLAYLNVDQRDHTLTLPQFHGQPYFLYVLSPGDADGLTSSFIRLNGRLLDIVDKHLPVFIPQVVQGNITLPALTFGFIVVPKANIATCEKYSTPQH